MSVFRSIVFSASLAGLIVGAVISVAQFLGTVPLIQKSEVYERKAAAEAPPAAHEHAGATHHHDKARSNDSEWEPEDRFQRNAFTVAANILTAVLLWITDYPGEQKTLARAREILSQSRKHFTENFVVHMAGSSAFEGAIRERAEPFIDLAPETYSGVMNYLAHHTRFLSDPRIKKSMATSSFSMRVASG